MRRDDPTKCSVRSRTSLTGSGQRKPCNEPSFILVKHNASLATLPFFEVGDEFPATLNASKPRQNCEAPKLEKHRMPYRGFELYSALRCRRVPRQLTSQILAGESWLHLWEVRQTKTAVPSPTSNCESVVLSCSRPKLSQLRAEMRKLRLSYCQITKANDFGCGNLSAVPVKLFRERDHKHEDATTDR
jgi:hypothetical protein